MLNVFNLFKVRSQPYEEIPTAEMQINGQKGHPTLRAPGTCATILFVDEILCMRAQTAGQ